MFPLITVWHGVGVHLIKLQADLFLHVQCIVTGFVSAINEYHWPRTMQNCLENF